MANTASIIVTGAAGFIGSALIWELNRRRREDILAVDLLGTGDKFRNLVPLRFVDYLEGDRLLAEIRRAPATVFPNVRTIYHLGANSSTTERDNRHLVENNYEYTKELAHWAYARGIRFVYASSAATYGDGAQGMDDHLTELHRLRPLNMYGYSKHLFDLYAQRQGWLEAALPGGQGRFLVGVKYFNVFGPNEAHKGDMRSVVPKATAQIQATGRVQLFRSHHPDYRDGEQKRDFLYVKDAVAMTLHLGERQSVSGLFNLGNGKAQTWIELVTPIFEALDKPVQIDFIDMPEALRGKYQYFTQAKIEKLKASNYHGPFTPLSESVREYVRDYLVPDRRLGE